MAIPQRIRDESRAADEALAAVLNPPAPPTDAPPAPAPTGDAPPAPAPSVQPTDQSDLLRQLQHQLQTEQGRVSAQNAEMAELRGRLSQLTEQLAKLPTQAPAAPAPAAPPLITDEDKKDFGEDMIDFVQRMIRQHVGNVIDSLGQRVVACEQQLRRTAQTVHTVAQSAEEEALNRYLGKLDGLAPRWRQLNEDRAFLDWLEKRDTFSRKKRAQLLADAHAEADAETVAAFFNQFLQESGQAEQPAPTPTPTPRIDPATLVAPAPAASPTPAANPRGGRVWTEAEINKAYDDRLRGRTSAEAFAPIEQEIMQALADGRVRK